MIEDMNARKLGSHTQRSHVLSCKRFAAFLKRSPDTATAEDIRQFQLHLSQTSVSICNRNRIMTGLRFLFRVTLRRLDLLGRCRLRPRVSKHWLGTRAVVGDAGSATTTSPLLPLCPGLEISPRHLDR